MTNEEKIIRLKDILSEISENEDAVCYLTSEDNELIKSAIEALEQEPCGDCISRQAVLEALEQEEPLVWCDGADEIAAHNQWSSDVDTIKNMPSVRPKYNVNEWCKTCKEYDHDKHCCPRYNKVIRNTVEEIKEAKTGHWIFDEILDKNYYCSECKSMGVNYWDYCPYCGAKMVEPQEE